MHWNKRICFLLMVDASGSMNGGKIELLNRTVTEFIEGLQETLYADVCDVGIIAFGAQARIAAPMGSVREIATPVCFEAKGATLLTEAIDLANQFLKSQTTVVLFSDGIANDGQYARGFKRLHWAREVVSVAIGYDADDLMLGCLNGSPNQVFYPTDASILGEILIDHVLGVKK